MKRLFCIIGSLLICTSSVFAWNAESFLSDGSAEYQPYELDPVEDPALDPEHVPMMMSLRDGVSVASDSSEKKGFASVSLGDLIMESAVPVGNAGTAYVRGYYTSEGGSYPGIEIPDVYTFNEFPAGFFDPYFNDAGGVVFTDGIVNLPVRTSDGEPYEDFTFPTFLKFPDYGLSILSLEVDVSSYNATAIEFLGNPGFSYAVFDPSSQWLSYSPPYRVFVDDSLVGEFTGDMGGLVFQSSNVISKLRFELLAVEVLSLSVGENRCFTLCSRDGLNISFLFGDSYLDSVNKDAQNDINEHNAIESEWTGSMTENFNALDLSGFSFPGGLIAAFALITGIFNDLWNGMGDYKILYVFPLTLGVVLLLIGRISKFSDRSSSANSSSGRSSSGRGGKGGRSA